MDYIQSKKKEQELKRKIDLEYLQVSEEIKEALCNIERRVKAENEIKRKAKENNEDYER